MSDSRQPRSTQTREKTSRRKPWAPPSRLDAQRLLMDFAIVGSERLSEVMKTR